MGSHRDYIKVPNNCCSSMAVLETDNLEIYDIVSALDPNTSCGYDEISSKVIKSVIGHILPPLVAIFNNSLQTGVFPDQLKIAKVRPIHKSDDKLALNNYRPISVLPVLSKILEKLMYKRLLNYLHKCEILTDKQYGFRQNHSTYMAIIDIVDKISNEIDNKNFTAGVFIDLSKAFDTIDHDILLDKMYLYGIRGVALNWFKSYLHNRKQYVQIDGVKSELSVIKCGVPQGSILGPLLFILYINDIINVSDIANIVMFADDTNIFFSGKNLITLTATINSELDKISNWFKLNRLSLNIKKTHYILFCCRNRKLAFDAINIKIDGVMIEKVTSTKFLGVIINESLTWNEHIQTIKQKVSKSIGIIKRLQYKMPRSVLKILYTSMVAPYLEYCNIVWGIDRSVVFNSLFLLQKKIIRIITNSKWNSHSKPLFHQQTVLPLACINDFQIACFMYRSVHNLLPIKFTEMFRHNLSVHSYGTRQKDDLHKIHWRLHIRKNTVRVFGPGLWNSLPRNMRDAKTISIFKIAYKTMLIGAI